MSSIDSIPPFPFIEGVRFAHAVFRAGYAVSDDGNVWSCLGRGKRAGKIDAQWRKMSIAKDKDGYSVVTLRAADGTRKQFNVASVVLESFVGPRPVGYEACHFPDSDKSNNALNNLMWGARGENISHRIVHGTWPNGERNGRAKLTASRVADIRREIACGGSVKEIAARENVDTSTIRRACNGETWDTLPSVAPAVPSGQS